MKKDQPRNLLASYGTSFDIVAVLVTQGLVLGCVLKNEDEIPTAGHVGRAIKVASTSPGISTRSVSLPSSSPPRTRKVCPTKSQVCRVLYL